MNKLLLTLATSAVIAGGILLAPQVALAYRGDPTTVGPNYSVERHEAMEKAFENKDYNAWKALMQGRGRVTQVINQDNFARFAEAHRLAEEGKVAEAQTIRQELGLGLQNGSGRSNGAGRGCTR